MRSETSFQLDGDLIIVDAVVRGPSGRANVQLVLDTGAVLTTLAPSVAKSIGRAYPAELVDEPAAELAAHASAVMREQRAIRVAARRALELQLERVPRLARRRARVQVWVASEPLADQRVAS